MHKTMRSGDEMKKEQLLAFDVFDPQVWIFPMVALTCTMIQCSWLVGAWALAPAVTMGMNFMLVSILVVAMQSSPTSQPRERWRLGSIGFIVVWTAWVGYTTLLSPDLRLHDGVSMGVSLVAAFFGILARTCLRRRITNADLWWPKIIVLVALFTCLVPVDIHVQSDDTVWRWVAWSTTWFPTLLFMCAVRIKDFSWPYLLVSSIWTLVIDIRVYWLYAFVGLWLGVLLFRTGTLQKKPPRLPPPAPSPSPPPPSSPLPPPAPAPPPPPPKPKPKPQTTPKPKPHFHGLSSVIERGAVNGIPKYSAPVASASAVMVDENFGLP